MPTQDVRILYAWSPTLTIVSALVVIMGAGLSVRYLTQPDPVWFQALIAASQVVLGLLCAYRGLVRVRVDGSGLTARSAVFGRTLLRVPAEEITDVFTEKFSRHYWGGVGLYQRHGDTALSVRGPRAVVMRRPNGARYFVAIRRADDLAQALQEVLFPGRALHHPR